MNTFGELLTSAFADRVARGQVFWIANTNWDLPIYAKSKIHSHPGLVCSTRPTLAPGTSDSRAGKRDFGNAFQLQHPEVLNDRPSTFFLAFRKYIPNKHFGLFINTLHAEDLRRLNKALGPDYEDENGAH